MPRRSLSSATSPSILMTLLLLGCGGSRPQVGLYPRLVLPPEGARCYHGTGPALAPVPDSTWLVLGPALSGLREFRAYTVRSDGSGEAGAWAALGQDSVRVYLVAGFRRADFRLLVKAEGLEGWGRESGSTPHPDSAAPRPAVPIAWPVGLRRAACTAVPPASDPP